jgi:hypothetical protein
MINKEKNFGVTLQRGLAHFGTCLVTQGTKRWLEWLTSDVPFNRGCGEASDGRETAQYSTSVQSTPHALPTGASSSNPPIKKHDIHKAGVEEEYEIETIVRVDNDFRAVFDDAVERRCSCYSGQLLGRYPSWL